MLRCNERVMIYLVLVPGSITNKQLGARAGAEVDHFLGAAG